LSHLHGVLSHPHGLISHPHRLNFPQPLTINH
jgi:hypothetical protein